VDLFIVRHAWAHQRDDPRWPDDSQRPLSDEGRRRFVRVVELLGQRGFAPELVAASPYVRCRQTAELIAQHVSPAPDLALREELEPEGDWRSLLAWTSQQFDEVRQMAWVGHAPDVGEMVARLIGDGRAWVRMAKGAVALVRFYETLKPGQGELRWLATARLLGC